MKITREHLGPLWIARDEALPPRRHRSPAWWEKPQELCAALEEESSAAPVWLLNDAYIW